jgi:hypothetical protein
LKPSVQRGRFLSFCFAHRAARCGSLFIGLDGQRVRGLLRGRTVESRTHSRCRNLGRDGECTGGFRNLRRDLLSGKLIDIKCVLRRKSQRILLAFIFPCTPNAYSLPSPILLHRSFLLLSPGVCGSSRPLTAGRPSNEWQPNVLRIAVV